MNWYLFFKLLHIAGVLLWIGPPLGAYWVHLRGFRRNGGRDEELVEKRVRRAFVGVLGIEHAGLLLLLSGALGMLWIVNWGLLAAFWVLVKIGLVLAVVVPLEILDVWWGQIALGRVLKNDPTAEITPEQKRLFRRYDRLVYASIPLLLISWAIIFVMAVFKPA